MRYTSHLTKLVVFAVAVVSIITVSTSPTWAEFQNPSGFNDGVNLNQLNSKVSDIYQYITNQSNSTNQLGTALGAGGTENQPQPCPGSTPEIPIMCPSFMTKYQGFFTAFGAFTMNANKWQIDKHNQSVLFYTLLVGPKDAGGGTLGGDRAGYDIILNTPLYLNNMAYVSTLGLKPGDNLIGGSRFDIQEYIYNASGLYNNHLLPTKDWKGTKTVKAKYTAYFKTITAIESFSTFVISRLQADYLKMYSNDDRERSQYPQNYPAKPPELQDELVKIASGSEWTESVSSENIGKVFRHILLFESQNYVVNMQILQNLREINMGQAMNNSLMIMMNAQAENQFARDAQGLGQGD